MKILLLGGTTEGRLLAQKLSDMGHQLCVLVATTLGAEELVGIANTRVLIGRKSAQEISELLLGFDLCIDATHPYAEHISAHAKEACSLAGVPLKRVARSASKTAGCTMVASADEAAEMLAQRDGAILLTTGSKELASFAKLDPHRLFVRVLPTHEALDACEQVGVPHRNIVALYGPFTQELNEALLRQYKICWMVTKDGGNIGGMASKLAAAHNCGVQTIVIARPTEVGEKMEALLDSIGEARP